jgi:hypothetical protein
VISLTKAQANAIIRQVQKSDKGTERAKKAICWLIQRAQEIGTSVSLSFAGPLASYSEKPRGKFSGLGSEASFMVHDMHLYDYLAKRGIKLHLRTGCGMYNRKKGVWVNNLGFVILLTNENLRDAEVNYVISTRNEAHLLGLVD